MRTLWGALLGVCLPAAFLVAPSGAAVKAPSGDTCTATGNGTSFTLNIAVTPNGPSQGGFAFGASGVSVTNINIAGNQGALSTQNLPTNTTGEWLLTTPAVPGGTLTASLTTSGPVTGSFTVVAANSPPSTFSDPFLCALATGSPLPSNAFTVNQHVTYDSTAGAWHLVVSVPGAGTVSALQAVASSGGSGSKPVVAKSLVQTRKVVATSAGKFTLTLRPTPSGSAALKANGSIKLKLNVAFSPKGGKSASKIISLTLRPKM
jgi:hypothetical protein